MTNDFHQRPFSTSPHPVDVLLQASQQDGSNAPPIVFNYNFSTGNFEYDFFTPELVDRRITKEDVGIILRNFKELTKTDGQLRRLHWYFKLLYYLLILFTVLHFVFFTLPQEHAELAAKIMIVAASFLVVYTTTYVIIASCVIKDTAKKIREEFRKLKEYEASQSTNGLRWKARSLQIEIDQTPRLFIELHRDYLQD